MTQESRILGVTVRGWIAVMIVVTVCTMSLMKIKVEEPLYTLVISAVSFYLGSRNSMMKPQENVQSNDQKTSPAVQTP